MKISGYVEMFLIHKDGEREEVYKGKNTIQTAFFQDIIDQMESNSDKAFDNLFAAEAQPPTNGEDGIALFFFNPGLWYEVPTVLAAPTATSIKFTGTYDATVLPAGGVIDANEGPILGHDWQTNAFTNPVAVVDLPGDVTIDPTDTLVVEWTITFA